MVKRLECRISGRVQLVMFRDFARRKAERLGLVGFVQNNDDGTVTAVAEGDEEKLKEWLSHLWRGPVAARVDNIETRWLEAKGEFRYFEIRY